jgi:hypothetical protein
MPTVDPGATARQRLVTVTAVLALTGALTGCSTGGTTQDQRSDTYRGHIATVVVELDDRGGSQIGTTSAAVGIRIAGADREGVQMDRTLEHTDGDEPEETVDQRGDTLTLTVKCPDGFTIGTAVCRASYEIQVPYGTAVAAKSDNGSLTVEDTRGRTDLHSSDGDVTVVAPGGFRYSVKASSPNGTTKVDVPQHVDGVQIRAVSDNGDVTVRPSP